MLRVEAAVAGHRLPEDKQNQTRIELLVHRSPSREAECKVNLLGEDRSLQEGAEQANPGEEPEVLTGQARQASYNMKRGFTGCEQGRDGGMGQS